MSSLARLIAACALVLVFSLLTACRDSDDSVRTDPVTAENSALRSAIDELAKIEQLPSKLGEQHNDPRAARIVAAGTNAAPLLVARITDTTPSGVTELFSYTVGDIAHRLLCEIYQKPFLWPVADAKPIGEHPQTSFQDYIAFVSAPDGREKLRRLWSEVIQK